MNSVSFQCALCDLRVVGAGPVQFDRRLMMDIQPIRNEQDYDRALAEIEGLWGAEEGTEAGDKLDILLTLVEDYEDKHHRISPPDPVEAIKFRTEPMNLTRKEVD